MSTYSQLNENLKKLKLLKMQENIDSYIDMINEGKKSVTAALTEMTELELSHKADMAVVSCVKVANFPFLKELKDFDFDYQPSINKQEIMDLASLRFLENHDNIIFCGSPGVGKTNLAVSIGIEAAKQRYSTYFIPFDELISQLKKAKYENRLNERIKWFCRYKLLLIDELGYEQMDTESANLFMKIISKRYEKTSTIITTNLVFSKWIDVFQDPVLTNALLDRFLHHCSVISINGPSYRLKDHMSLFVESGE